LSHQDLSGARKESMYLILGFRIDHVLGARAIWAKQALPRKVLLARSAARNRV
jgi:hypothetical protein